MFDVSMRWLIEWIDGLLLPSRKSFSIRLYGHLPLYARAAEFNRSYTSDFEIYHSDFDPQKNPQVKVYIAINR
jgi:hypothetical protein